MTPTCPRVAERARARADRGDVASARHRRRRAPRRPVRRPAARRHGRRHRPGGRRGPALGRAHQALHDDRNRARPGQDLRRHRLRRSPPSSCGDPSRTLGTTTFRPPYTPVAFAALAGRDRGSLLRPRAGHRRSTTWHVAPGAVFEDVGQWKRPRYYPQPGEDMEAAVLRECAAGAAGVGILDGSTLGKIDVQGPDAADLPGPALHEPDQQPQGRLDPLRRDVRRRRHGPRRRHGAAPRPRTASSSTPPPAARRRSSTGWRSGCRPSGRDLRVHCTSVTEQWATVPRRRPPLARRARRRVRPAWTSRNEAFPFMTWRDTTVDGRAGAGGPDQLLRRARLRGQRQRLVRRRGVGARCSRPGSRTASRPTARRPCTCCARRRATRSSARTPTARSPRRTWAWPGRSRRRSPTSSASGPSPGPDNQDPLRKQLVGLLPVDRADACCRRARRSSSSTPTASCRPRRCPCSATSPPATAAPSWTGPSPSPWSRAGRSRIGDTVHVPVNGTPRPGRGHRAGAGRSRRSPSRWLSCCAPTPLEAWIVAFERPARRRRHHRRAVRRDGRRPTRPVGPR